MMLIIVCLLCLGFPFCGSQFKYSLSGSNYGLTYREAVKECVYSLPNGQIDLVGLMRFMAKQKISSCWLAWEKLNSTWTWVNDTTVKENIYSGPYPESVCGTLQYGGTLSAAPCYYTLPCICEFRATLCETTAITYDCIQVKDSAFLCGSLMNGWYTARAFCRHLGGDLAILDTQVKRLNLEKHIVRNKRLSFETAYWIGFKKEIWVAPVAKKEFEWLVSNLWDENEPRHGVHCSVFKIENGIGKWKAEECRKRHQTVCIFGENEVTLSQLYAQYQIKSRSFQTSSLAFFKLPGEKTGLTAAAAGCRNFFSDVFYIPNPVTDYSQLKTFIHLHKIQSAWVDAHSVKLPTWKWSNDLNCTLPIVGEENRLKNAVCGSLDHLLQKLYEIPCHWKDRGYICQYDDLRPCWTTYLPQHCLKTGGKTIITNENTENWFTAQSLCTHLGSRLAILTSQMIRDLIKFYKTTKRLKSIDFFFIGLQYEVWTKFSSEGPTRVQRVAHNLWFDKEPAYEKKCAVFKVEDHKLYLVSANCSEEHSTICFRYIPGNTDNESLYTSTVDFRSQSTSLSNDSYKKVFNNSNIGGNNKIVHVLAGVGSAFLLLAAVSFFLIWKVAQRLKRKNEKMTTDMIQLQDVRSSQLERLLPKTQLEVVMKDNIVEISTKIREPNASIDEKHKLTEQEWYQITAFCDESLIEIINIFQIDLGQCTKRVENFISKCVKLKCLRLYKVIGLFEENEDYHFLVNLPELLSLEIHLVDITDCKCFFKEFSFKNLRLLFIEGCNLKGSGEELANCVSEMSQLQFVNLCSNDLKEVDFQQLLLKLKKRLLLKGLMLSMNDIGADQSAQFAQLIDLLSELRVLCFSDCGVSACHTLDIIKRSTKSKIELLSAYSSSEIPAENRDDRSTFKCGNIRLLHLNKLQLKHRYFQNTKRKLERKGGHLYTENAVLPPSFLNFILDEMCDCIIK